MNKRDDALRRIRFEYAMHGEATLDSVRAYCENRVSKEAHDRAAREGMAIHKKKMRFDEQRT